MKADPNIFIVFFPFLMAVLAPLGVYAGVYLALDEKHPYIGFSLISVSITLFASALGLFIFFGPGA